MTHRPASEQVWALVSGLPRGKREGRLLMVFQAYVDDSGSEPQSQIFVFSGFVASHDEWARCSDEWQVELDRDIPLAYFKMAEAASLRGEFDRKRGWDEIARDKRVLALARIVRRFVKIRISAWISHDDWATHITSLPAPVRRLSQDSPFSHLALQTILAVMVFQDRHGIIEPIDFIFDQSVGFDEEVLQWWPNVKWMIENSARSDLARFLGSRPIFRNEKCFLPLQAGDLYAWQVRNHYIANHRSPRQTIRVPRNAVLRELWPIPAINREFPTAEVIRLREYLLGSAQQFAEMYPGIPLLPPISDKRERQKAHRKARISARTPDPASSSDGQPS